MTPKFILKPIEVVQTSGVEINGQYLAFKKDTIQYDLFLKMYVVDFGFVMGFVDSRTITE